MSYETAAISYFPFGVCAPLKYFSLLDDKRVPVNAPFEAASILTNFFQNKIAELDGIEVVPIVCFGDACKKIEEDIIFQNNLLALVFASRVKFWFFAQYAPLRAMQKFHQKHLPDDKLYFHTPSPEDTLYAIGKRVRVSDGLLSVKKLEEEQLMSYS